MPPGWIKVEGRHTYWIGEGKGVLVHNDCNYWWRKLDSFLGGVQVVGEFVAGGVDSLTFGTTDIGRKAIFGEDLSKIQHPRVYVAGGVAETIGEVALTGGSAALKKAVSKKMAREFERRATKGLKQFVGQKLENSIKDQLRRKARRIATKTPKQLETTEKLYVHHIHTLDGRLSKTEIRPYKWLPPVRPGKNLSPFPTMGVEWLANNKHNLVFVTFDQHYKLHQRAYFAEQFVSYTILNPMVFGLRFLRNSVLCLRKNE